METQKPSRCKVVLSPSPIKTKERIDIDGNIIDPKTKEILVRKEKKSISPPPSTLPPITPEAPVASPVVEDNPLAIQDEIEQAEANLVKLKEKKKIKIKEVEEVLNKLKNI